jgi:prepilin-type N-terminal cleavage/methylation domain-containing protein
MKHLKCPSRTRPRPGFSLVELMVVMAIIAILAALVAAATMQVMSTQRINNTELVIKKVSAEVDKQWRAVAQQAMEEPIPPSILYGVSGQQIGLLVMARGRDPNTGQLQDLNDPVVQKRARLIWVKLRLKQQFPQNFMEALVPTPRTVQAGGVPYVLMPPEPAYVSALIDPQALIASGQGPVPSWWAAPGGADMAPPPATDPATGRPVYPLLSPDLPLPHESTAMLLLALGRARRGVTFDADSFASNETKQYSSANGGLYRAFADAWAQPLAFYRWPTAGVVATSNPRPPTSPGSAQFGQDPMDPENLLMSPAWNNGTAYSNREGVWAFEKLCHLVHNPNIAPTPPNVQWPQSYYSVPTVVSGARAVGPGANVYLYFGFQAPAELAPGAGLPPALVPDVMAADNSGLEPDNIYSCRLRVGARGGD